MALLTLPAEVRNRIYHYVFDIQSVPDALPRLDQTPLAICLVCKQLYHETYALAVSVTPFWAKSWDPVALRKSLSRVLPVYRPLIKTLCLKLSIHQTHERISLAAAGLGHIENLHIRLVDDADRLQQAVAPVAMSNWCSEGNDQLCSTRVEMDIEGPRATYVNIFHDRICHTRCILKIHVCPQENGHESYWDCFSSSFKGVGQRHFKHSSSVGHVKRNIFLYSGNPRTVFNIYLSDGHSVWPSLW